MTRRRRTSLTPEDRALWRAATRGIQPLPPELRGKPVDPPADPPPGSPAGSPADPPARGAKPPPGRPAESRPEPPPRRGVRPAPPATPPRITVEPAAPALGDGPPGGGIDRRTHLRLKRGQIEPEARIDLHGMSAERAHPALERFIGQALARGLRLVLVITGKGGARAGLGPDAPFMLPPPGVLRRQSPRWLRAGPHGREIVGMWSAHPRHGGPGAMYVYLRKRR